VRTATISLYVLAPLRARSTGPCVITPRAPRPCDTTAALIQRCTIVFFDLLCIVISCQNSAYLAMQECLGWVVACPWLWIPFHFCHCTKCADTLTKNDFSGQNCCPQLNRSVFTLSLLLTSSKSYECISFIHSFYVYFNDCAALREINWLNWLIGWLLIHCIKTEVLQ